ncbi:sugar transporter ERD6-like 5 isoform X2 [Hibiscus syriacus]|uniref:sugar transporter ERD6-like 5 isoform X2 n=1 Tax=Hibiscus syriacus TaxID=106335 RepID=UPI001921C4F0|nr:sugar transporter ERD6-like 5 isoform X2 [Hibiscus syriacus]
MEKNEVLEGLVTGKPVIIDEAATSVRYGDSTVGCNHNGSSSVTGTVIFSTLVAISGAYAFGNAVGYSSPVKSGITEDLGLSLAEYAVFSSILTVGGMLGAACSGKIADLLGGRGAMGISEVFCITGWLAIVFSKDAQWLNLGRLLIGCGSGVLCYVIPLYLSEIATKNVRGAFASLFTVMLCCGKAVMFIIGSLINWRTSALIGVVPCVLQLIGVFFIPESPRWLAKTNETKEFEATLRRLRGEKANISQEATDIRLYTEYMQQIADGGLRNLFQKRYINPLIVGVGLMVFQQFGGLSGFSYYTSFIFESAGFPSKVGSIAIAVLQILMAILGVLFIDKSGRRPLLLVNIGRWNMLGLCHYRTFILPAGFSCKQGTNSHIGDYWSIGFPA